VTATATGSTSIRLNWGAPASLNGGTHTGYNVEHSHDGVSWTDNGTIANTVTTLEITGLPAGVPSYFRVAELTNSSILGAYAYTSGSPIQAAGVPAITSVIPTSFTSVTASWNPPATTGGTALIGYAIEYKLLADTSWTTATADTNSLGTSYTITGLTTGATYSVRVAAVNASTTGTFSSPSNVRIIATPAPITSLSATGGNGQIVLAWPAPSDTASITAYKVEQYISGKWVTAATPGIGTNTYTATAFPKTPKPLLKFKLIY
jgi:titin